MCCVHLGEPVPKFVSASDESLTSNPKTAQGSGDGTVAKPAQTSYNEAEFADSLNAAKVAAMKAAEMGMFHCNHFLKISADYDYPLELH